MTAGARDQLLSALEDGGWRLLEAGSPARGRVGNPTRVDLRRGTTLRRLLLYGWNATREGAGRKRHDLGNPRYRVQTTRTHEGDLRFEPGRSSVGIGWRADWDVFFAFDLWAKRFSGSSSSVFVDPPLLQAARDHGAAEEVRGDVAELAFNRSHVDHLFAWLDRLAAERRTVPLEPDGLDVRSADHVSAWVDTRRRTRVTWLRPGDYTVLYKDERRMGDDLWRVRETTGERVRAGAHRVRVHLELQRWGTVRDDDWLRE
jgi:hypothetical protein